MATDRITPNSTPLVRHKADVDALVDAFKTALDSVVQKQLPEPQAPNTTAKDVVAPSKDVGEKPTGGQPDDVQISLSAGQQSPVFVPATKIGPLIAQLRKQLGLTQTQLAYLADTSQSAIARLETGGGAETMSLSTAQKIFSAMNYEVGLSLVPKKPPAA